MNDALSRFRACVWNASDRVAIHYFDGEVSYRTLDDQSDAMACWLLDRGIIAGDRIASILQNMPQFVVLALAAWKVGAIIVPCNPMYKPPELSRILTDAEPSAIICLEDQVEVLEAALALSGLDSANLIATSPYLYQSLDDRRVLPAPVADAPRIATFETIIQDYAGRRPPERGMGPEDIALLLYTSGTTGVPKAAMIRHRNLCFVASELVRWCGLDATTRIYCVAPFFHITGFALHVVAAFTAQAAMVMHYRFEPSLALDIIRRHQPTFTIGAITAFNALMGTPGITATDMACFKSIYSGGAPIPPPLLEAIETRLQVKIHSSYGLTESCAPSHLAPFGADIPVDPATGALSIGKPIGETSARIVDAEDRDLPVGQRGELLLRGPQVMAGYWRRSDADQPFVDGWLRTGDVAFVDEEGWFYLVDRLKDMIIASGFKVWPREVEDILYAHPAVREAAVVGIPDSYRGETVKACVSLKQGVETDADQLIEHCRAHLAAYKVPRLIDILPELPKTVTGKIQRAELRSRDA